MASSFAEKNSNKLTGIIFLGAYPSADLSMTELKMLSIYGTEDLVLNRDSFDKNKDNAPAYVEYYEIEGGNHAYFGNYGEQKGDGKASITVEAQQKETVDTIVKFIETK